MLEIEFAVPSDCDLAEAENIVEHACSAWGLELTMKGSLKSYPGSVHWHYKSQGDKGTLELTLFARRRRLWAKVQHRRRAPWIDAMLPKVQKGIELQLKRICTRSSNQTKRSR
jgi:hypothetical protein